MLFFFDERERERERELQNRSFAIQRRPFLRRHVSLVQIYIVRVLGNSVRCARDLWWQVYFCDVPQHLFKESQGLGSLTSVVQQCFFFQIPEGF